MDLRELLCRSDIPEDVKNAIRAAVDRAFDEGQERFRLLIENAPDAIFVQTRGLFAYVNRAALALFGAADASQLLGTPVLGRVHPSHRDIVRERIRLTNEERVPTPTLAQAYVRLDGSELAAEVSAVPIAWEGSNGALVFVRDITERMAAEERLQRERDRAQLLLDVAEVVIVALDPDGAITLINRKGCELLGYSPEELLGRNWFETCLTPETRAQLLTVFGSTLAEGSAPVEYYENPVLTKDGRERLVAWHNCQVVDPTGRAIGYLSAGIDVAEQRAAEAEVEGLKDFYQFVLDTIDNGVWVTGPDDVIDYASATLLRLVGVGREDAVGVSFAELFDRHPDHPLAPYYRQARSSLERQEYRRVRFVRTDGSEVYASGQLTPIVRDGVFAGMVCTTEDVTDLVLRDQEAGELRAGLERAQRLESLGVLAGGIAHDFNNILAAVFGYTEMAMGAVEHGSQAAQFLAATLAAAERARDLVQQILTFSRGTELERRPVLLQGVVEEALRFVRASLPSTIEIHQYLDSTCDPVLGEASQLYQVLVNLCTNAHHAMRDRDGVLNVSLSTVDLDGSAPGLLDPVESGRYVRLTVADTGCGMDDGTRERIFDPFFTTKSPGEGTGLGLSVVHGIVTAHRGTLLVESTPGEGSAFHVFLRVGDEAPEMGSADREAPPRGTERILVVEDEPALLAMVAGMLRSLGYRVSAYSDAPGALAELRAQPADHDLLFTDQTMPGLTGAELARQARLLCPDLPIVIATGLTTRVDKDVVVEVGIREVLPKPYTLGQLARAVRRAISRSDGGQHPQEV